ncbi:MAG: hypothetical protein K0Q92_1509 [Steroidobacteraceae bacterium]|jgi:uncharacterized protein YeaO (DUF488 family)|nr:hypothetical protein [Steroidobacteraceae bacterium]
MTVRIVRLGSARASGEGTRLGTVRRPPRGVAKKDFARLDWYDVWFPLLAPSPATMKMGLESQSTKNAARADKLWAAFSRKYLAEMRVPAASQALDALAALSRHANFSVGCYCQEEARCHRSLLRALLAQRGANIAP